MNEIQTCRTHSSLRGQSGVSSHTETLGSLGRSCHVATDHDGEFLHVAEWSGWGVGGGVLAGFKPEITGTLPHNSLSQVLCPPAVRQRSESRNNLMQVCRIKCVFLCAGNMCMVTVPSLASASSMITTAVSQQFKNTDLHKQMYDRNRSEGGSRGG